ncbi:unnamed protein product [Dovyalis caffra]|uniref:Peptidase S8/S53 domain-containing protein n=1 Tax=Dovyalis caffra TaxID=77055 RepID=A0AAV1STV2_9ROSI|nr:unnamed protein product [Dovyalis caffra]
MAAPGVSILATSSPAYPFAAGGFSILAGTSFSTPYFSEIVALLKVIHPSWSPSAIKSAIVKTAGRSADPFDLGGGLVNPNKGAEPGLVYDMGTNDYIHFLSAVVYNDTSLSLVVGKVTICSTENKYPFNNTEKPDNLSSIDVIGHGTHVSTISAGSLVGNARAFDEAMHDGVDLLSLPIGSIIPLFSDVYERDGIATGAFHVSCAAGNTGPEEYNTLDSNRCSYYL